MAVKFFNRNIPDECHQVMTDFVAAGNDIAWVAFAREDVQAALDKAVELGGASINRRRLLDTYGHLG